jgi:hypothetical protein
VPGAVLEVGVVVVVVVVVVVEVGRQVSVQHRPTEHRGGIVV